jgi:hypothetical protein
LRSLHSVQAKVILGRISAVLLATGLPLLRSRVVRCWLLLAPLTVVLVVLVVLVAGAGLEPATPRL